MKLSTRPILLGLVLFSALACTMITPAASAQGGFPGGAERTWAAIFLHAKTIKVYNTDNTSIATLVNTTGASRTINVTDIVTADDMITALGAVLAMANGEKIVNAVDGVVAIQADDDAVDLLKFDLKSSNSATANGDKITVEFMARSSGGTTRTMATVRMEVTDITDASEDAKIVFAAMVAGALTNKLELVGSMLYPTTDDGLDLGDTSHRFLKAWLTSLDADGLITFSTAVLQGGTMFTAEGATADAHEKSFAVTDPTSDTTTTFPDYSGDVIQTNRVSQVFMFTDFVPGATSGWVVTGVNNGRATLPAGQTGSTLVARLTGLHTGDIITGFTIQGQVESAGNAATLDAILFKNTSAAGDITEANIGAITQVSVTADAIVSASKTLDTPETIAADESFYVLITGTTAAATDFDLQGAKLTLTKN